MAYRDQRGRKPIAELIRNFRSLRILACLPPSDERDEFLSHLRRMGSRAEVQWPPPLEMPASLDVVFLAVRPLIENDIDFNWNTDAPPAALIAVVDYENPLIAEAVLSLNAQATIGIPFRSFGVMIDVLLSIANFKREQKMRLSIQKMRSKISMLKEIEKAKEIVAQRYAVDGDVAYKIIRQEAMNKRVSVESVVRAINAAVEILSLDSTVVQEVRDSLWTRKTSEKE